MCDLTYLTYYWMVRTIQELQRYWSLSPLNNNSGHSRNRPTIVNYAPRSVASTSKQDNSTKPKRISQP